MQKSPKNFRLHIGIFGRRNVGKSSLLNSLTSQNVSLVSDTPGTTTDPVEKPMELLPFGPVLFIDTAGIDDFGALGELRVGRTRLVLDRTELGIIVTNEDEWGSFEKELFELFKKNNTPMIVVINRIDQSPATELFVKHLKGNNITVCPVSALTGEGIDNLRQTIMKLATDADAMPRAILADLVPAGSFAVLVIPIDKEAPKGRIILPQVQAIRDLLDHDRWCIVAQDSRLPEVFANLKTPPALVVTDSQAFDRVAALTPADIPLTSFSILFARFLSDLDALSEGARAIANLKPGDNVLIAESCSHHPIEDDIGTIKIPKWLNKYAGGTLNYTHVRGHDFPKDLSGYRLVVHCGGCMGNRREMLSRINICKNSFVPITNYGLAIAWSLGVFDRALKPFQIIN